MADDPAAAEPDATDKPDGDKPDGDAGKTFTQDQVNDLLARQKGDVQRKYADYDDLKSKAERLDEIEESNRTELERAQGKLSKAEERAGEAEAKLLRYEVASEKKVPPQAVDFLKGTTKEELEASADKLLELVAERTESDPQPDFDGGAREPATDPKKPEQAHDEAVLALLGLAPNTP